MTINISVIMTCHNRKAKTLRCLDCLFQAADAYNQRSDRLQLAVFLTDDGCTDGTAEAVCKAHEEQDITIVEGDGNLYWAGGMRKAWAEALNKQPQADFYLLANDDTYAFTSLFSELLGAHQYCLDHYGATGIYSGATCDSHDHSIITYSGDRFDSQGRIWRISPSGKPEKVDITNANMLLVPHNVVGEIGIFYDGYTHGAADNDYALQANRHNHPALITAHACAFCDDDHQDAQSATLALAKMTLDERRKYLSHPLHSDAEYLMYIKRNFPRKYPLTWVLRKMRLYMPMLYIRVNQLRGIY